MRTIWGFDLGVTSVGFAVLQWDGGHSPEGKGEILRVGVRIFPESREEKDLSPRNAVRRQKRLARRQMRRRRWRRVALRRVLAEAGLLSSAEARPPAGQDPYLLRAHGLRCALMPEELGWALFHLLKRRGFQGSRKRPEAPKTAEEKKAMQEEQETEAKAKTLAEKLNGRPLAEYLGGIQTTVAEPERRRNVGQTRAMVEAEMNALWAEQRNHHPGVLTEKLRTRIDDIALAQRPTYFRRRTIGHCELEPEEERALKAEWLAQRFEVLQLTNALRLEGGNQRTLDEGERATALDYLERQPRPTWAGLRNTLKLPKQARFTHERGKKETIRGNATEVALRTALGTAWVALPDRTRETIRNEIGQAWHCIEYRPALGGSIFEIRDAKGIATEREKLARRAEAEWGLSATQAAALAEIDLPDGTARHSVKAMRRLLPYLERGQPYMTALQSEYGIRESGTPVRELPGPNRSELARITDPFVRSRMESLLAGIRNPIVLRTLGELQKVVNTLLRVYGPPDLIRLETTRELKQSPEDRRKTDSEQRAREQARADARKQLARLGKAAEGRDGDENVSRLLLWQEQGGRCPYSGQQIGCADALSATATEIDHIFPASRSFDDSQANKVLCFVSANRHKGNQTPYEWLNPQGERWAHLTGTVWPQMRGAGWPERKLRRCLKANFEQADEGAFTNRQLTDTSFIARAARDYLGLLFGGGQEGLNRVQPVSGRATAQLRRAWGIGLGRLLRDEAEDGPKARDDHRHHAVDALAVALAEPGTVQQLSRWWQVKELTHARPSFPPPWPEFRSEAKGKIESIVVSHRVQAKLTGPLHEETRLGDTGETRGAARLFVKRKALAALTPGDIEAIRDPAVRAAVELAIRKAGGNVKQALGAEIRLPRKDGTAGPLIRRVRLLVPRSEGVMRVHARYNMYAELGPGSNDHIAIYRDEETVRYLVVTKRQAMERTRRAQPVVLRVHPQGGRLLMALRPGDLVHRRVSGRDEFRMIRKFLGNGQIFFKTPTMARRPKPEVSNKPAPLVTDGWRKVSVDAIGTFHAAK